MLMGMTLAAGIFIAFLHFQASIQRHRNPVTNQICHRAHHQLYLLLLRRLRTSSLDLGPFNLLATYSTGVCRVIRMLQGTRCPKLNGGRLIENGN